MGSQDGKITNPAAPPFATSEGKPTTTSDAMPTDLVASPTSKSGKGGDRSFPNENRRQSTEPPKTTPADASHLRNRPQQAPITPAQRVAPQSIPQGGTFPNVPTVQPSAGAGSIGNGRRPFKVK